MATTTPEEKLREIFDRAGLIPTASGASCDLQQLRHEQQQLLLTIPLLQDIRAWLISLQPARGGGSSGGGRGSVGEGAAGGGGERQVKAQEQAETVDKRALDLSSSTLETTSSNNQKYSPLIRTLFKSILTTAALPSITNPHRTITCDVLSTWLIRASSPASSTKPNAASIHSLLREPFTHPNSSALQKEVTNYHISTFTTLTYLLLANFDSSASAALMKALKDLFGTLLACYRNLFHVTETDKVDVYISHLINETLALIGLGKVIAELNDTNTATTMLPPLLKVSERRRKAAYFILEVLVSRKVVSAAHLLSSVNSSSISPSTNALLHHLLTTVSTDRTLASAAAKSFLALITARKSELLAKADGLNQWTSIWDGLLRAALRGELIPPEDMGVMEAREDKAAVLARGHLTTYVLPGVFRLTGVYGLKRFVEGFGVSSDFGVQTGEEWDVNAWLCCIRVGREMGFVGDIGDTDTPSPSHESGSASVPTTVTMNLPPEVLPPLLTHPSLPIRISALTLLTASKQTTRAPSSTYLALLRDHLPNFHALTDPEGRNIVTGLIRSFIDRLAGASSFAFRKALKERNRCGSGPESEKLVQELDSQVEEIRQFVEWYVGFIRGQMLPGKGFPRVGMALRVLKIWINSDLDDPTGSETSLLSNKNSHNTAQNTAQISSLRFPFHVPIFNGVTREGRVMVRLLLECLFHSFEDVRVEAASVIKTGLLPAFYARQAIDIKFLRRCFDKVKAGGGRARDADGLARILEIIYEAAISWDGGFRVTGDLLGEGNSLPDGGNVVTLGSPLEFVGYFINNVLYKEFLAKLSSGGLAEGVTSCSTIHGVIAGLRLILGRKDVNEDISRATGEELAIWRGLHKKIISFCCDIWDLVGPALCAAAPEGHIPDAEDEEEATGEGEHFYSAGADSTTQSIMSYSWRAIKESSELLGVLLSHAPYPNILSYEDISRSGELLIAQLANSRHPGAFAAVSPCLLQLSKRCFTCHDPEVQKLPRKWLEENSSLIVTKAGAITRRSAGIPFLIIGILAAENDPQRPLLHQTFTGLVKITKFPSQLPSSSLVKSSEEEEEEEAKEGERDENGGSTKMDLPQVHALNCIKLLFSDSRLGPIVSDLIGDGLEVSVSCFVSPVWAIRNGGLMLFTSLLNRLFGTSKSRNDYSFTANLYTTERFFGKYPAVRGVLLGQLRQGVESLSSQSAISPSSSSPSSSNASIVEMVYPTLSLLSRLGVSPGYSSSIEDFKTLILACMKCKLWKVREVAAKAYVTLIGPEECIQTMRALLTFFLDSGHLEQNTLHGNLCAVKCLLERRIGQVPPAIGEQVHVVSGIVAGILIEAFQVLVMRNECLVTRALYLEIVGIVAMDYDGGFSAALGMFSNDEIRKISTSTAPLRQLLSEYASEETIFSEAFGGSKIVGNPIFREQLSTILAHCAIHDSSSPLTPSSSPPTTPPNKINEILSLFQTPDDEVILAVIKVLLKESPPCILLNTIIKSSHGNVFKKVLWKKALDDSGWSQVRVGCMRLLGVVIEREQEQEQEQEGEGSHVGEGKSGGGDDIEPRALLDLVKNPRTIPLKEAALVVLGKVIRRVWEAGAESEVGENEREVLLREWLREVNAAAGEDMPYPSRESALESLSGMAPVLKLSHSQSSPPNPFLLPLYITLYGLLNDDDPDIRESSSTLLTQHILPSPSSHPITPPSATHLLSTHLLPPLYTHHLLPTIVAKLTGNTPISQLLAQVRKNTEVLFVREKRNLWVDELGEVGVWREVGVRVIEGWIVSGAGGDGDNRGEKEVREAVYKLREFAEEGTGALREFKKEVSTGAEEDTPLTWTTSSEEIFLLGWRVFTAIGVLRNWTRCLSLSMSISLASTTTGYADLELGNDAIWKEALVV